MPSVRHVEPGISIGVRGLFCDIEAAHRATCGVRASPRGGIASSILLMSPYPIAPLRGTIVTAPAPLVTRGPVRSDVAITGQITQRGEVLRPEASRRRCSSCTAWGSGNDSGRTIAAAGLTASPRGAMVWAARRVPPNVRSSFHRFGSIEGCFDGHSSGRESMTPNQVIVGFYDSRVVVLSIVLAVLSPCTALALGMRERAWLLGGEVTIRGGPGNGTTVRVQIPATDRADLEQGKT